MLATLLNIFPPVILVVGMLGVGLSIDRKAMLDIARQPLNIALLIVLQMVLVPAVGVVTVMVAQPEPAVVFAILLIAACPGGGISNIYVHFARGNVSLSVVMTVTSLALSFITLPLAMSALQALGYPTSVGALSPVTLTLRLLALTILPVAIGMVIRAYRPQFAMVWSERLTAISLIMILMILIAIVALRWSLVIAALPTATIAVVVFLGLALALGRLAGQVLYRTSGDRFAVMTEFGVRNLSIATYIAVSLEGNLDFAGYAAIYFVLEAIVILVMGAVRRGRLPAQAAM